ncbi:MAG: hypothetical protein GX055_12190 [Desulfovibrionales bacterium]|nr:hypothetical protein [Desulfovibrionales bacterium]
MTNTNESKNKAPRIFIQVFHEELVWIQNYALGNNNAILGQQTKDLIGKAVRFLSTRSLKGALITSKHVIWG